MSVLANHELTEDVADMRESVTDGQGTLRRVISTTLVSLYKEHFSKDRLAARPIGARPGGGDPGQGYTARRRTLFEAAGGTRFKPVRSGRTACRALRHDDRGFDRTHGRRS
jgi:hypothetical protein